MTPTYASRQKNRYLS